MATCAWSEKEKTCGRMTQDGSIYCPRHTFLHNIAAQKEVDKAAEKQTRVTAIPKTRGELLAQGYEHVNNATCSGCHKPIEWWKTPKDRKAPYDPMREPNSPALSHFATCRRSTDFRRAS